MLQCQRMLLVDGCVVCLQTLLSNLTHVIGVFVWCHGWHAVSINLHSLYQLQQNVTIVRYKCLCTLQSQFRKTVLNGFCKGLIFNYSNFLFQSNCRIFICHYVVVSKLEYFASFLNLLWYFFLQQEESRSKTTSLGEILLRVIRG